jgi:molybdopterin-guanine dinucleotide biosynthesis protein A
MSIAGVILAGGGGSRLGHVLKANIILGGRTLLSRVADRFAGCVPLLLSTGPHDPAAFTDRGNMVPVPDLASDYGGPLAGVVAAAAVLSALPTPPELLLTSACDSPLLPADYLARLMAELGDAPGVLAAYGDMLYPTNGLWRLAALRHLVAGVTGGTAPRSLKRFAAETGARTCTWQPGPLGDPFANANTPEDLAALAAKFGRDI